MRFFIAILASALVLGVNPEQQQTEAARPLFGGRNNNNTTIINQSTGGGGAASALVGGGGRRSVSASAGTFGGVPASALIGARSIRSHGTIIGASGVYGHASGLRVAADPFFRSYNYAPRISLASYYAPGPVVGASYYYSDAYAPAPVVGAASYYYQAPTSAPVYRYLAADPAPASYYSAPARDVVPAQPGNSRVTITITVEGAATIGQ